MTTSIRPVIGFDLDGTLITCKAKQIAALRRTLTDAKVEYESYEAFWELKRNGATTRDALVNTGVQATIAEQAARAWVDHVESWDYMSCDTLFDRVADLLDQLGRRATLLLLSARREPALFYREIAALGLERYFAAAEVVPAGGGASQAKAARLVSHGACCYVGDTESDMDAASGAGIPIYVVATGQRSPAFLREALVRRKNGARVHAKLTTAIREVEHDFFS